MEQFNHEIYYRKVAERLVKEVLISFLVQVELVIGQQKQKLII
jgi:hypothetical protein